MKNLILTTTFVLFLTGVFAQTTKTKRDNAYFGIKAGVNISTLKYSEKNVVPSDIPEKTKARVGFNITGYGNFDLGNNFFIQPGISLQNKGGKYQATNHVNATLELEFDVMAIEIPVNVVYNIPTGNVGAVQINAGPYMAFNISGKKKEIETQGPTRITEAENLKFGNKKTDHLTRMDLGLNFGLGYKLTSGFTIGANYGLGLMNTYPEKGRTANNEKFKNYVFGLAIGYSF